MLFLSLTLIALHLQLTSCELTAGEARQFQLVHNKVQLLQKLISSRCPNDTALVKPDTETHTTKLEAENAFDRSLSAHLQRCQAAKVLPQPTERKNATTPTQPTERKNATTLLQPTECKNATTLLQPTECKNATTLRDIWRTDYEGKKIKPGGSGSLLGWACDIRKDLQWFRFAGPAGSRMLDRPPKPYSCGTHWPYWTDGEMPKEVGVVKQVEAHGVQGTFEKAYTDDIEVMRCSTIKENDFVYRHLGPYFDYCQSAFCGMQ